MLYPEIFFAIKKAELNQEQSQQAFEDLIDLIPEAVNFYLGGFEKKKVDYKFAAYFGWYIAEIINPLVDESRGGFQTRPYNMIK